MLTDKQRAILNFIVECQAKGFTPTRREISERFGFASPSGPTSHLEALEKKGCIRIGRNKARMIVVMGGV